MRLFTSIWLTAICALFVTGAPSGGLVHGAQDAGNPSAPRGLDQTLDLYVRDGLVYYRALKGDRGRLDAYVRGLASTPIEKESSAAQLAFWLNAYNAIVLHTVIDHYPMPLRSKDYPAGSIRQIPGAFERLTHRIAGRTLTLKLKDARFKIVTRRRQLPEPTLLAHRIFEVARELLAGDADGRVKFRLIGVGLSDFSEAALADRGDMLDTGTPKRAAAEAAVASARAKFGKGAVQTGRALKAREE